MFQVAEGIKGTYFRGGSEQRRIGRFCENLPNQSQSRGIT